MPINHDVVDDDGLDIVFRKARTHYAWTDEPVSAALLRSVYDLMKWAPTSSNSSPARFVFVSSNEAKQRLAQTLAPANVEKVMTAPVTAIIATDTRFHEHLPFLFPHNPAMATMFSSNPVLSEVTAFRNSSLQGAYLMLAARASGLDCGPIGGFDEAAVNRLFFPDGRHRVNFLCNLGHGSGEGQYPRGPRLAFDEACQLL